MGSMMFYGGNAPQVFDISADRVAAAERSVKAANRRLMKAGITDQFQLTVEPYEKMVTTPAGTNIMVSRARVTLNRPSISYGGYTFLARVEESSPGNFVAMTAPGVELNGWRPTSMECEHCNKTRARSKVYVIADATGNYKVVGGSCVELYTGLAPSQLWAFEWDKLSEWDYPEWEADPNITGEFVYDADRVLAAAITFVRRDGYRNTMMHESTKDCILDFLAGSVEDADFAKTVSEVDVAAVRTAIREKLEGSTSDWAVNVLALLESEWLKASQVGTLASGVSPVVKDEKEKVDFGEWTNEHFIPEGAKIVDMKGVVTEARASWSDYGAVKNITIRTDEGYRVFWRTGSDNVPEVGETIRFDARVKRLDTYQGKKSTVVSRLSWYRPAI